VSFILTVFVCLLFLQDHRETDHFFLKLQEFSLCHRPVDCSISSVWYSPHRSNPAPSPRLQLYGLILTLTEYPSLKVTHSPITLANLSSINLVSIFRCSSPPRNPVYVRCVDPSVLVFRLTSHRHSYICLIFNSHFIDS
jgi:hypothetical protein